MHYKNEADIVKAILSYLRGLPKCFAFKTHGNAYQKNVSDIVGVIDGRALFLEVKKPETINNVTDGQKKFIEVTGNCGAISAVVVSIDQVKEVLCKNNLL